jgi:hypothetical protein
MATRGDDKFFNKEIKPLYNFLLARTPGTTTHWELNRVNAEGYHLYTAASFRHEEINATLIETVRLLGGKAII